MIKDWNYNRIGEKRPDVKNFILEKNYKTIDIGASAMYWSYPECKYVADSVVISNEGTTFFNLNLEDKNTWNELLSYVETNGKFDFSICSHTLEDIFNPLDLIGLLTKISNLPFFRNSEVIVKISQTLFFSFNSFIALNTIAFSSL